MRRTWLSGAAIATAAGVLWLSGATLPAAGDDGVIRGIVHSDAGPEAGVWVIAATSDLETVYRKIVVTATTAGPGAGPSRRQLRAVPRLRPHDSTGTQRGGATTSSWRPP